MFSFISILWVVGGSLTLSGYTIPGYMVFSCIFYSAITSLGMFLLGRPLVRRVGEKSVGEAQLRYAIRSSGGQRPHAHCRRACQPVLYAVASNPQPHAQRQISTGTELWVRTLTAALPRSNRPKPRRPWDAITMRSHP
jgi:hypothetical protein